MINLEKIVKGLKKEKDWIFGMSVYSSLKLLECIPTSLYAQMYGTQKENNPITRTMMDSLGVNAGLLANQFIFGSLLAIGAYSMNKSKYPRWLNRPGTKAVYLGSAIAGVLAVTNWMQYFSK